MNHQNYLINKLFETSIGNLFIKKDLGKGKSGYSYLAELENQYYVLKLMHNEPCPYYRFGDNKVILEVDAYHDLSRCNIIMPELLDYNVERKYLVKEYIDGIVAAELIAGDKITESTLEQLFKIFRLAKNAGYNIDYFPSNFVIQDERLFYIDYECNPYIPDWDLINWGIYYWANSKGFREYLATGDILSINESPESGIPVKRPFEKKVSAWKNKYDNDSLFLH